MTSRFVQPNRFTVLGRVLVVPDHDYPNGARYDLTVAGYLLCVITRVYYDECMKNYNAAKNAGKPVPLLPGQSNETESLLPGKYPTYLDDLGRTRVIFPRSGPLNVFLWPSRFFTMDARTHYSDLTRLWKLLYPKGSPPVVLLLTDRGPDWSLACMLTVYYLGGLFLDFKMVILLLTSYEGNWSALNPVERKWAIFSLLCVGILLNDSLPGESLPPLFQKDIDEETQFRKEKELFRQEMARVRQSLSDPNIRVDGVPVGVHINDCPVRIPFLFFFS